MTVPFFFPFVDVLRYFPSHKSFNTVMYRADSDTVVQQGSEGSFERGGTCTSSESPRLREIQARAY